MLNELDVRMLRRWDLSEVQVECEKEALLRCKGEKQRNPYDQLGAGNSSRNGELN